MGRDEMRAADADRQAVADQLKAALDEGRLDLHEYDERLQQTYAAKTYGELAPLLSDLPAQRGPAGLSFARPEPTDAELTRRWLFEVWSSWLPVVAVTTAIWLISSIGSGELLFFWPIWVAGPWGAVLVVATMSGLASGEPRKQAEKRARKEQAKQLKRERRALTDEGSDSASKPDKDPA